MQKVRFDAHSSLFTNVPLKLAFASGKANSGIVT